MITEHIKFNCHILQSNKINYISTDDLFNSYKNHNLDYDLIYDNIKLLVTKCSLSVDKSTIFTLTTKAENDNICTK